MAVLLPLRLEKVEVLDEALEQAGIAVFAVAQGSQQREDAEPALSGHTAAGGRVLAGLVLDVELDPLAAVGVNGCGYQLVLGTCSAAGSAHRAGKMTPGERTS